MELKARELSISTSTITSYINREVLLPFISRFGNIYNYNNVQLNTKSGGVFHQENINDYSRTKLDPIIAKQIKLHKCRRNEFNNQLTIHYKYYESHRANIKLFTNGRLELTGIKTEQETELVSNLLIDNLKSIQIPIYYGIIPTYVEDINQPNISISHHFFLIYNNNTFDFIRYIAPTKKYYTSTEMELFIREKKTNIITLKKNINTIISNIKWENITNIDWNNSLKQIQEFMSPIISNINNILIDVIIELSIIQIYNNYLEFRSIFLDELNKKISNYMEILYHEYNKLTNVFQEDVSILNKVSNNTNIISKLITSDKIYYIHLSEIDGILTDYRVSNIETHLINSDYNVSFYINLNELVKVLSLYGIYNYYNPNSYPGILAKFYYNSSNNVQGICNCERHCSTREKKSICTKITISIFRPGSIIITGSKSIQQLIVTYNAINSILFKHYKTIKGDMLHEDIKQNSFLNNELRKLGRKYKILYFPKSRIIIDN